MKGDVITLKALENEEKLPYFVGEDQANSKLFSARSCF
jgi:hypothetical protein